MTARFSRAVLALAAAALLATASLTPAPAVAQGAGDADLVYDTLLYDGMEYRSIGPDRGGRSTAVAGFPDRPFTFLMGSTGGGVWRTTDAGGSWENITDGQLGAAAIGAVTVAPSDPSVIWVGTGSACLRGNVSQGNGVYRSVDGGKTWTHVGLPEAGMIGRIVVDPRDPDVAFVAALGHPFGPNPERGVYRTRDGGQSWERVLFVSDSTGAVDLAMNPDNPRIVYAAMWRAERKPWTLISGAREGGIWRTTNGGDDWERLEGGLPEGLVGKAAVTVSPADPDRVWVLIEAPNDEGGVYRSDDGGDTWEHVNDNRELRQRAWYYTHIYADPRDENTVYALNVRYYKSVDGGRTFEAYDVPHGDVHDLWINPNDSDKQVVANDGGGQVTLDGAENWSTYYNQPTAEFYRVFVDEQHPYYVYGPQQDNSTIRVPSREMDGVVDGQHWRAVGGCESGWIAIDPRDTDITYAGCYGGAIERVNAETGETRNILIYPQLQLGQAASTLKYRFQWNAPIVLDPHDPNTLYHASQYLHRTTDEGQTWETISPDLTRDLEEYQDFAGEPITKDNTGVEVFGTIFYVAPSPHRQGVIWAGTDDGRVHVTRDAGGSWTEVTPEGLPRISTINSIDISAHDPEKVYVAAYRYRQDDFTPYMFRTTDGGESWTRLSNDGIAEDHFVRVVREDPEREGLLYAGSEYGMYVSFDDGGSWQPLQLNLPVTPITDLKVHRGDLVVSTQGRSFWILDDLSPLRQLADSVATAERHLFQPRAAIQSTDEGGGSPATGAPIYYYFAEAPEGPVTLEILDSEGNVVRHYEAEPERPDTAAEAGEAAGEAADTLAAPAAEVAAADTLAGPVAEEAAAETPRPEEPRVEPDEMPAERGLNRLVWDYGWDEPAFLDDAVIWGYTGGPQAVPGTYTVRLSAGDWTAERTLEVRADPRIDTPPEAFEEQHRLVLRLRDMLLETHDAVRKIRSVREQVRNRAELAEQGGYGEGAELTARADSIAEALSAVEETLFQTKNESFQDPLNFPPMLDNQIAYLYGYVIGPDARPTAGAVERAGDLRGELDAQLEELQSILDGPVQAFSARLDELGVPAVVVPEPAELSS